MLNTNLVKMILFSFFLTLYSCSGDVEKCVEERMQDFYKKQKSGIYISDKIYNENGNQIGKRKRTPEEHEKKMKNICVRKRFKPDIRE